MSNLSYVVTLTAQKTTEIDQVMNQLKELKAFVESGAEFELRLGKGALGNLKKDIRDAVRQTMMEIEGNLDTGGGGRRRRKGSGGAPSSIPTGGELDSTLDELARAVRDLTSWMKSNSQLPKDPKLAGVVNALEFSAAKSGIVNIQRAAETGEPISLAYVRRVIAGLKDVTTAFKDPTTTSFTKALTQLDKRLDEFMRQGPGKTAAEGEKYDKRATEVISDFLRRNETLIQRLELNASSEKVGRPSDDPVRILATAVDRIGKDLQTAITGAIRDAMGGWDGDQRPRRASTGTSQTSSPLRSYEPVSDEDALAIAGLTQKSEARRALDKLEAARRAAKAAKRSGRNDEFAALQLEIAVLEQEVTEFRAAGADFGQSGATRRAQEQVGRKTRDRDSIAAKQARAGQRWFADLGNDASLRDDVRDAVDRGYVPMAGIRETEVDRVLAVMQAGAPLGMFADKENPRQAQEQFMRELGPVIQRRERDKDEVALNNPWYNAALMPPMVAERISALLANLSRSNSNELPPEMQEYEPAMYEAFNQLGIEALLGTKGYGASYRAIRGPANFYSLMQQPRPNANRDYSDPSNPQDHPLFGDADLLGSTPISLRRQFMAGDLSLEQYQSKLSEQSSWAEANKLTFYQHSAAREKGIHDALMEASEQLDKLRAEDSKGEINPRAWQEYTTKRDRLSQELMAGGLWVSEDAAAAWQDVRGAQVGRKINGRPVLLSRDETEAYERNPKAFEQWAMGNLKMGTGGFFGGGGDGGGGATLAGGNTGGALNVFVTNFSELTGSNAGGFAVTGELVTSLKNTVELLRKSALVTSPQQAKQTAVENELATRYKYKVLEAELDRKTAQDKRQDRLDEAKARAERRTQRVNAQISKLRAAAGPIDLTGDFQATGIPADLYRQDEGMFIRDLRSILGTYKRANQSVEGLRIAEALNRGASPKDQLRNLRSQEAARVNADTALIQMVQLMRLRADKGGDEALFANRAKMDEFLALSNDKLNMRTLINEDTRTQDELVGRKEQLAVAEARLGGMERLQGEVAKLQTLKTALSAYDKLETRIEKETSVIEQERSKYGRYEGIAFETGNKILGLGGIGEAAKVINQIMDREGRQLPQAGREGILESLRQGLTPEQIKDGQYNATAAIEFMQDMENSKRVELDKALQRRSALYDQQRALTAVPGQEKLASIDSYELNNRLTVARGQLTTLFGTKDPVKQEEALLRAKAEVEGLQNGLQKATTEGAERMKALAKSLGVAFTSVADLMANKLPEVNEKLETLSKELVTLAAAETNSQTGRQGGFMEGMARKVLQLSQYVGAGAVVYSLTNTVKAAAAQVVNFEAEIKKIQGVLDTQSPTAAKQVAGAVQSSALEYGTDLTQSLRAARVFAQTGMSVPDISMYTRATLAAQQGAGFEGAQASEFLIAARNIKGSDQAGSPFDILDRVSRIEARYAVTAQDLAQAVQRVGSLVSQFQSTSLGGVDAYDTIIGATTAIVEKTRVSGNQAATALRFILSRIAAPDIAEKLQTDFKIKLGGETPGQLRPLQDILQDISKKYVELRDRGDTVEASKLLVTFAGARQANIAAALLGDFGRVQDIAAESGMSFGDARIRADEQLNTVAGRAQQLNTAFFSLISNVMETSGALVIMREVVRGTAYLTQGAANVVDTKAGWVGTTVASGAAFYGANRMLAARKLAADAAAAAEAAEGFATARTVTYMTRLGQAALGVTRFLGGLGLAISALTLLYQGYRWAADKFDLPGSRNRMGPGDTSSVRAQYEEEAKAMAERLGVSPNELPTISKDVLTNVEAAINNNPRYGPGAFAQFLTRDPSAPNGFKRTDVNFSKDLNKAILEEFAKAIEGFEEIGVETDRLALAFDTLRLTAQGLSIEGEAAAKKAYDIGERLKASGVADFNALPGTFGFNTLQRALPSFERAAGLAPGFSSIGLAGGQSLQTLLRAEVLKLNPTGQGRYTTSPEQMMTALNNTLTGLLGVRGAVQDQYWSRNRSLWSTSISNLPAGSTGQQAIAAMPSNSTVLQSLTSGPHAINLSQQERTALTNQRLVFANMLGQLVDTKGFTVPGTATATVAEDAGKELIKRLRNEAIDAWVAGEKAAGRDMTAEQIARVRRAGEEQSNRESTMANVDSTTGAASRVRAMFLNPYLQYARRQSDITQSMEMLPYSPGYDYQSERAGASLELVKNLSSVRVNMSQQVMQDIVQIAAFSNRLSQAQLLADFDNMGDMAAVRELRAQTMTASGDPAAFESNAQQRANAIARLRTNRDMYEAFAKNWPQLWALSGGAADDPKATLGTEMLAMFEEIVAGRADAETEREFMRKSLTLPQTFQDALVLAQQKYAADQKIVFDREQERLRMVEQYSVRQLENARAYSMEQARITFEAGNAGLYGRQDLAFASQSRTFGVRREELEAERALSLARLEEELRLDPRNLQGQALEIARYDRTSQINQQYRSGMLQTDTSEQEALNAERLRRSGEIAGQATQLREGVAAPLKEVLSDFNKIAKGGIPLVVDSLAQTFQNLFAERAVDVLMGPAGMLTNSMNKVFSTGAFQTQYHINKGFIEGATQASLILRDTIGSIGGQPGTDVVIPGPGEPPSTEQVARFLGAGAGAGAIAAARAGLLENTEAYEGNYDSTLYDPQLYNQNFSVPSAMPKTPLEMLTGKSPEELEADMKKARKEAAMISLGQMGGSYGGALIGSRMHTNRENYGSQGASIGTALGSIASVLIPGVGPVIGPLVGGLLGGVLGGSILKKRPPVEPQLVALEKIERNTRQQIDAIENQTELLKPDSRFMNVPAGFLVPNFRPGGLGTGNGVTINVYAAPGQSETVIAQQVAKALQSELGTRGGSFDVRNL